MQPTDAALFAGTLMGSLMVLSVLYVYIRLDRFGPTGWALTITGLLFLGLSVWTSVKVTIDSDTGLAASFEKLNELELKVKQIEAREFTLLPKEPNKLYNADKSGFVFVQVHADPSHRSITETGILASNKVVSTAAQDSNVIGVPSISSNSFVMPVPKGMDWSVEVNKNDVGNVEIRWFSEGIKS